MSATPSSPDRAFKGSALPALPDGAFESWKTFRQYLLRHLAPGGIADARGELRTPKLWEPVLRVFHQVYELRQNINVLIRGETGTGKEYVSQLLHLTRYRGDPGAVFLPVNIAAISTGLFESELFGHDKGAFTGADKYRKGAFQYANGGTLFLDEIGELPYPVQAKLLRVIESGEVTPVGLTTSVHVSEFIVAATNLDIRCAILRESFRLDLHQRLTQAELTLPPLRERKADMPTILAHLWDQSRGALKVDPQPPAEAMKILASFDWPGGFRQIQKAIRHIHGYIIDDCSGAATSDIAIRAARLFIEEEQPSKRDRRKRWMPKKARYEPTTPEAFQSSTDSESMQSSARKLPPFYEYIKQSKHKYLLELQRGNPGATQKQLARVAVLPERTLQNYLSKFGLSKKRSQ